MKIENLSKVALHECIHYLQEKKDKNGNIIKLGLCDYTDGSLPGVGLNEASVQLMAAKAQASAFENVKYFDINLQSNTPTYYPLECALVNQMAYVIGEEVLFDSTLNANNNFRDGFISLTSEKSFFSIQKNIDLLIETQEKLSLFYSSLEDSYIEEKEAIKITQKIELQKQKIKKLFLDTQKLILTSYFDNAINLVYAPKAIENYRNKLYLFKNLIGYTQGDNFYNEYYIDKMMELERKYEFDPLENTSLVVVKQSLISRVIQKLKLLFGLNMANQKNNIA